MFYTFFHTMCILRNLVLSHYKCIKIGKLPRTHVHGMIVSTHPIHLLFSHICRIFRIFKAKYRMLHLEATT